MIIFKIEKQKQKNKNNEKLTSIITRHQGHDASDYATSY